jgi:hypothetical protein
LLQSVNAYAYPIVDGRMKNTRNSESGIIIIYMG